MWRFHARALDRYIFGNPSARAFTNVALCFAEAELRLRDMAAVVPMRIMMSSPCGNNHHAILQRMERAQPEDLSLEGH